MPRFPICLAETLRWEGGYSDDPYDPGGKTMHGIIQREYDAYRRSKGLPTQWVKVIADSEVTEIYYDSYWLPVRADETFEGLDLELFDYAVNSGPVTAIKHLQQVLGGDIKVDGHMGTQTIAAIKAVNDREGLVERYIERRRAYLKSLKTFWRFGKGWIDRCDGIEHSARAQCQGAPVDHVAAALAGVPQPHSDPDTQSAGQGRAPAPSAPAPPQVTELGLAGGGATLFLNAAPDIIADAIQTGPGHLTLSSLLTAILKSKVFWGGVGMAWGALATYLWRRRHAQWHSS